MENLKMPKYSSYRDSGVDWLGVIPSAWETKRIKFLFQIGRGRVIAQTELDNEGVYPVYSSQTQNNGILGYINTYDFDCTQITWTTDGANAGTIFLRTGKHNCTNVCGTLKPINNNYSIDFIKYSLEIAAQFYKRPDTNGAKIMNGEMAVIFVTFPPLSEQTAIAAFLDRKTALVDQAIGIKQKQIELLKERRQILIHKAVTRGLNPDVKMKASGVEWIGEIPEGWEVFELKRLINPKRRITYGIVQPGEPDPQGRYMIRGQDYSKGWADSESLFRVSNRIEEPYKRARVITGDIIITIVGAGCGNLEIIPEWLDGANLTQTTARVAIDQSAYWSKYFYFSLLSNVGVSQMRLYIKGAAQPGLNLEHIKIYKLPIPSYKEQIEISNYIDGMEVSFTTAISLKEQEIEKLKEYKATLINSAVTGKIKVS